MPTAAAAALRAPASPATFDPGAGLRAGKGGKMTKPSLSKAELRAQLEAAIASYQGTVTYCPPGAPPEPEPDELDFDDDEEGEASNALWA